MPPSRPALWVALATAGVAAALLSPVVGEARRDGAARAAWRRDYFVPHPLRVASLIREGGRVVFVDVRESEYDQYRIPGALHVPLRHVNAMDLSACRRADLVICYCWRDLRGFEGARILRQRGLENVGVFEGFGLNAWMDAGLPVAGSLNGLDDAPALAELSRMDLRPPSLFIP